MDKVQKIREEVERLQNELIQEKEKGFGSDTDDACILELQNILTYIDSLQEEPVIVDAPPYDYVKGFSDGRLYEKRQKEKPVSEDLELTWEDIPKIFQISEQLKTSWWFRDNEQTKLIGTQTFWEEVLKRFNKQRKEN